MQHEIRSILILNFKSLVDSRNSRKYSKKTHRHTLKYNVSKKHSRKYFKNTEIQCFKKKVKRANEKAIKDQLNTENIIFTVSGWESLSFRIHSSIPQQ